MRIGLQTKGLEGFYGTDGAYRMLAECGFDAADASLNLLFLRNDIRCKKVPSALLENGKSFLELFRPWRNAAEKYQIGNDQAHAPYPSFIWCPEDPEYNDILLELLKKMIIGCDYIHCRKLVIHPFFYPYEHAMTWDEEREVNINRYSRLINTAKNYGVTICMENIFTEHRQKCMFDACSDMREVSIWIDELNRIANEKVFALCLDIGHLHLLGLDVLQTMKTLGSRISAFHIHDNNGIEDQHTAPYFGIVDWDRFIEGLRVIQYKETLSFETVGIWEKIGRDMRINILKYLAATGRYFAEQAEMDDR